MSQLRGGSRGEEHPPGPVLPLQIEILLSGACTCLVNVGSTTLTSSGGVAFATFKPFFFLIPKSKFDPRFRKTCVDLKALGG